MKNIINIIKLDAITVSDKATLLASTLLPIPFLIIAPQFGVMICMMILGNFFHGVFVTGEKSGYCNLYGALPITKKELVAARFIEAPLLCLTAGSIASALAELSIRQGWADSILKSIGVEALAGFFTSSGYNSIFTPAVVACVCFAFCCYMSFLSLVDFKWGVAKEGPLSCLITFSLCGLVWLFAKITDIDLAEKIQKLAEYKPVKLGVIFISIGLAFELILALVTYQLIKNEELK